MAAAYNTLVVQQIFDGRPSPTAEVQQFLNHSQIPQPSPSLAAKPTLGVRAPPTTPILPAPAPLVDSLTPCSKVLQPQFETLHAPADDICSLPTDQHLAERYYFDKEIGFGNWGSVWRVQPKFGRKVQLAAKVVYRTKEDKTTPARVRSIWQEFKIIRKMNGDPHPNIIRFYDLYAKLTLKQQKYNELTSLLDNILSPGFALVVMDIHDRLMPTGIPEARARLYFASLLSGIDYLHSRGVTHNDIKPANILLSRKNEPVVVDFGFANRWSQDSKYDGEAFFTELSWGTPEYLSPERATAKLHDERLSDIWSLGVTMYEILVGRTPFEKDMNEEFLTEEALEIYLKRTAAGSFLGSYRLSLACEDLLRQMVEPSVALRLPTCAKGLLHPFFSLRPPSVSPSQRKRSASLHSPAVARPLPTPTIQIDSARIEAEGQPSGPRSLAVKCIQGEEATPKKAISPKKKTSPKKPVAKPVRSEVQIYSDSPRQPLAPHPTPVGSPANVLTPRTFATSSQNSKRPAGLRPLLLRVDSSQKVDIKNGENGVRSPAPSPSIPRRIFGDHERNIAAQQSNIATWTARKPPMPNRTASAMAQHRDSKELRSPDKLKSVKELRDKENVVPPSPVPSRKEALVISPNKQRSPQEAQPVPARDSQNIAATAGSTAIPGSDNSLSSSVHGEQRKPARLSKRRPADLKIPKTSSVLSFNSLSSGFRGPKSARPLENELSRPSTSMSRHNALGTDNGYAFVNHDGRTEEELREHFKQFGSRRGRGPQFSEKDVIYIMKSEADAKDVPAIPEQIISPQEQRQHAEAVAEQTVRSNLGRSTSSVSNKRLPKIPARSPAPTEPLPSPPPTIVKRSLAPSFASHQSTRAVTPNTRSESRQSDISAHGSDLERVETDGSDAESLRSVDPEFAGGSDAEDVTAVHRRAQSTDVARPVSQALSGTASNPSRPRSATSAGIIRSCWSPETCQSEAASDAESEVHRRYIENFVDNEDEAREEDEGDATVHAKPVQTSPPADQTRRNSVVLDRSQRPESIYQSFSCASPVCESPVSPASTASPLTPASFHVNPPVRNSSLANSFRRGYNATWSPSSRAMQTPTPDILKNFRYHDASQADLADIAPFTRYETPDSYRSLVSPPPRPDTSQSKRTLGKMKSFFGRFGFGTAKAS